MDVTFARIATTVISFITFVAIWVWAYSKRNAESFDEAAQLPFQQD